MPIIWSDEVGHWEDPTLFVFDVPWYVDEQQITSVDFAKSVLPPDMTPVMALVAFLNPMESWVSD